MVVTVFSKLAAVKRRSLEPQDPTVTVTLILVVLGETEIYLTLLT